MPLPVLFFPGKKRLVSRLLFRMLLCPAGAFPDLLFVYHGFYMKLFVMLGPGLFHKYIVQMPSAFFLYLLLQDRLTVIEKLLVFQIRQYKSVDKCLCTGNTAVQIDGADQRLQYV